ncbi:ABC transporter ATP-binding protein/permease [Jiella sp. MQZ9-1]|uniref:ABC transporter ATP-binding protein n=1 Tax=Jiella flava TaxID=2816857 RepID=A0A939G0Q2_9HYPH|nr:ABC transporter ATP-binding protein/permease [Jiella flava]MBO0663700.1 ABC transporter ATP-binding protein [Jiella flava]MCD2472273.1 ABC transporter ATP-binding protein/permease [Jiella flava]
MKADDELDESIFRYVWRYTRRQQMWLFGVLLLSLPLYYLTLDLPKRIVNGPIQGTWPAGHTETLFAFSIPLPGFLGGGTIHLFDGIALDRVGVLIGLSLTFLFFVIVNGLFKFYLSTYKGKLGERLLRRLRFQLVDRVLRFPTGRFKQVRGSEIASMIKDETEPVGGFGGSAFADPALLMSQALTALVFIVMQNFWLGLVAALIVAVQIIMIPRMRRRLVVLARHRQLTARILSGRIGEVVEGIVSIRTNDTSNYERAEIGERLGKILKIRYDFYQWKFFVNFLNNLLAQTTPFIFYLGGGYLVITGRLDIGQLVAVIAAYKDLPSPLKELIAWDQFRVDVQSKYAQIREQFVIPDLVAAELQQISFDAPPRLDGEVTVSNLRISDDSGNELLYPTTVKFAPGESVALVGPPGGGGEYLAEALVRLLQPSGGRVAFAGAMLDTMPDAIPGRRLGYSASGLFLPQLSVRDSLTYGLKHAPLRREERTDRAEMLRLEEARLSGNIDLDIRDDWIDYEAAGVSGADALPQRLADVLAIVELRTEIARLGLRGKLPEMLAEDVTGRILDARARFRQRLIEGGDEDYFESFDRRRYSDYATVFENLVFGIADPDAEAEWPMADRPSVRAALEASGLDDKLVRVGRQIAETLMDIFGDLAADNPLLDDMDLMSPDEVEIYRAALRRSEGDGKRETLDRQAFQRLAFGYVEPRHRLGLLEPELQQAIVAARDHFADGLEADLRGAVSLHDPAGINRAASLQDNILFGRIITRYAEAAGRINTVLAETLREAGLFDVVFDLGLDFDIGSGAKRLSAGQQQKLTLARAILKRPDVLVLNRPLSALDGETQRRITAAVLNAREELGIAGQTVVWVLTHADHAELFDRTMAFRDGRLDANEERRAPSMAVT